MKDFDFQSIVQEVSTRFGKSHVLSKQPVIAIKFPSLILRVLFQNDGLPLGKIIHIVGEEATFKSTLALEISRWHINYGGIGILLHTESRLNHSLIDGVLKEHKEKFFSSTCDYLEEWQAMLLEFTERLGKKGQEVVTCITVDSVLGVNSEKTIKDIMKSGFASARFAVEANLISTYLRTINSVLYSRPHTICLINHRKFRPNLNNPYGGVEKASLGGNEIRYAASFEIETTATGSNKQVLGPVTTYKMGLKLDKNTFGQDGIQISVPIHFVNHPDGCDVTFDWHAATTFFLAKCDNVKPIPSQTRLKAISDLIPVKVRPGGRKGELFYSEAIGIDKDNAISATEFGMALEERQDILNAIYEILGISRRYILDPNLSYTENLEKAIEFYEAQRREEERNHGDLGDQV